MCSQVTDLKNHPRERITFFSVADSISSENGRAHFRFRSAIYFPGEKKSLSDRSKSKTMTSATRERVSLTETFIFKTPKIFLNVR